MSTVFLGYLFLFDFVSYNVGGLFGQDARFPTILLGNLVGFGVQHWTGHSSMAAAASAVIALLSSPLLIPPPKSNAPPPPFPSLFHRPVPCPSLPLSPSRLSSPRFHRSIPLKRAPHRGNRFTCRAAEYKFPDPIPDFAAAETDRFRTHMLERLTKKKEHFGDSVGEVVDVCTEILSNFLHTEYGGPGTLLVIPFIDMADTLREKGLPGAPQAARAAIVWAQKHVDEDWNEWTVGEDSDLD
ncbi:unnamed protein product [Musa hybrid cultivar]